jgi:hypothetical protein
VGPVKISAFSMNIQDLYEWNDLSVGQKDQRVSSIFQSILLHAVQQHFTHLENFESKECVEVLDSA